MIHLAAYFDFTGKPNPEYQRVNVQGTEKLIRALQSFEVEQFVYVSTMLVHARTQPGVPIDEDWPLEPKWPYPQSKVETESIVRTASEGVPTVVLRLAGVYTDDRHVPSLATQIQRICERQVLSHVFPGDASHGQAFVSLLHLYDRAYFFVLVHEAHLEAGSGDRRSVAATNSTRLSEPARLLS